MPAHFTVAMSHPAGAHIRQVWAHNVEQEFALIRHVAPSFPFATIDTEFPGVVYEVPTHPRNLSPYKRYELLKKNVDCLKLIQFGLTLSTSDGSRFITWEFNFCGFNPLQDPHSSSSIQLLEAQGMDLWKSYYHGVDPRIFAFLMNSSGLLCNPSMTWVGFHLAYDMGYLVKVLTGLDLPDSIGEFLKVIGCHFGPRIFDIKYMCKSCEGLEGGLEKVARKLNVQRAGGTSSHHAGSDSLLTWDTFRSLRTTFLREGVTATLAGIMCGIQDV